MLYLSIGWEEKRRWEKDNTSVQQKDVSVILSNSQRFLNQPYLVFLKADGAGTYGTQNPSAQSGLGCHLCNSEIIFNPGQLQPSFKRIRLLWIGTARQWKTGGLLIPWYGPPDRWKWEWFWFLRSNVPQWWCKHFDLSWYKQSKHWQWWELRLLWADKWICGWPKSSR